MDAIASYVRRSRMEAYMNAMKDYPLTFVTAPIGYGKTVTVRRCMTNGEKVFRWVALSRADNSVKYFWEKWLRCFRKDDSETAQKLDSVGFPTDDMTLAAFFDIFINSEYADDERYIILDDYNHITNPQIHDFICMLAQEQLENFHIILISSERMPPQLQELTFSGFLYTVDMPAFEFNTEEIKEYFSANKHEITLEQAQEVYKFSEGWITAIHLMMLFYAQSGRIEVPRNLEELMETTMLNKYDDETLTFFMKLSVFESFDVDFAREITGRDDAEKLIKKTKKENAFLRYNPCNEVYRMSRLLRNYLYKRFISEQKDSAAELYKRAGKVYLKKGYYIDGLEFLYKAVDYESIPEFLESRDFDFWERLDLQDVKKYFHSMPIKIKVTYFITYLKFVFFLVLQADYSEAKITAKDALYIYETSCLSKLDADGRLRGEIYFFCALTMLDDMDRMLFYLQRADELLPEGSALVKSSRFSLGYRCASLPAIIHKSAGNLQGSLKHGITAANLVFKLSGEMYFGGMEDFLRAEYYFLTGKPDLAKKFLYAAMEKSQSRQTAHIFIRSAYYLVHCFIIEKNGDEARRLWNTCKKLSEEQTHKLIGLYETLSISICASTGEQHNYVQLIEDPPAGGLCFDTPEVKWWNLALARAALVERRCESTMQICQNLHNVFNESSFILGRIYTSILQAAATYKFYNSAEFAKVYLRSALRLAQKDRIVMPFVVCSGRIIDLLKQIGEEKCIDDAYMKKILDMSETFLSGIKAFHSHTDSAQITEKEPKFTAREEEVIAALINCQSNKEIAYSLNIKEGTVKKILYNIYQKLEVNSRSGAIRKLTTIY